MNLAAALAGSGAKVLLVDLDPQASLTKTFFGPFEFVPGTDDRADERAWPEHNVVHLLRDRLDPSRAIAGTGIDNLSIICGHIELRSLENDLKNKPWNRLAEKILGSLCDHADYVFFDTPGSTGIYSQMAMIASEVAVVTVPGETLSLYEIPTATDIYEMVREYDNPGLALRLLLVMVDGRTREARETPRELEEDFRERYIPSPIPKTVDAYRSIAARLPLVLADPDNAASRAYVRAAEYLTGRRIAIVAPARMRLDRRFVVAKLPTRVSVRDVLRAERPVAPQTEHESGEREARRTSASISETVVPQVVAAVTEVAPRASDVDAQQGPSATAATSPTLSSTMPNRPSPPSHRSRPRRAVPASGSREVHFSWPPEFEDRFRDWYLSFCRAYQLKVREVGQSRFARVAIEEFMARVDQEGIDDALWDRLLRSAALSGTGAQDEQTD